MRGFLIGGLMAAAAWLSPISVAQSFIDIEADPAIPTLQETFGYSPGEEITAPADALAYMKMLADAAPDRMKLNEYARTWEGRKLVYGVISSPENMARIDEIQADIKSIASGTLSAGERADLVARTPAVVWLSYGVHGDEISSTDAALALAYHLLAAENDATVDRILDETIVIIDPMQNPDGRARFKASFEAARGLETSADPATAEHDQPWPGGRYNHYLFDMNRDWFAMTQPETVGRVEQMLDWYPVVVVDVHEMGGEETYFFAPSADPFNPYIRDEQRAKQTLIGKNHARWFDSRGFEYFTREVYDAFYPGYADMWPQLGGAVAMTYEQGSARGLEYQRKDGSMLTYRDGVEHHFISTLSTAEVVANNHDLFLGDFADYRSEVADEGRKSKSRYFIFDLAERRWQVEDLGRRLAAQEIAVQRVGPGFEACGTRYPSGALVVDRAQPAGRRIATLLEKETELPVDYVAEQEGRRDRGLNHELYDVTAWSLPLMDGVTSSTCSRVNLSSASLVGADDPIPAVTAPNAAFGYAIPWTDTGGAKLALAALKEGAVGKATEEAFIAGGRSFPRGTIIFPVADNTAGLGAMLNRMASEIGAEVVALQTSWVEDGPNYGSDKFKTVAMPRVAMAWGEGTIPTETGATRYVIERQLSVPVAPIRVNNLAGADLGKYDVLIVPDTSGDFAHRLGDGGAAALKSFVEQGGVLVGVGGAVDFLASADAGLLSTKLEKAYADGDSAAEASGEGEEDETRADGTHIAGKDAYDAMIADPDAAPDDVPGVLANVVANTDHWLSSGYAKTIALYAGSSVYRPLMADEGTNVFHFAAADELLASGYLWEENRAQIAFKPFVMVEPHGEGMVIAFTESPFTRAYLNGLNLLVANALIFGPAHAR
ncbi:M14 family zinc carboxypeptidase [Henriciella mobilis]|uniref:Carboxypeptidase n=1 Tax=Henriciella mobilis TaxID=2305467 RepID=A0A399RBG2_9PROT|nr:M14 family zinc carboxypeptidase [Henriciella mobilis]RIJ27092.1 carboxypeptidase [Henriciella mobilis]